MTAHVTLSATADRDSALAAALKRIEAIMLPGACALAGTRQDGKSPYWIERERDCSYVTRGKRCVLFWKDQGTNGYQTRAPYTFEGDRPTYSVQVVAPDDVTPGELSELARLAALYTGDIVRECMAITNGQVAVLESERDAFAKIASE